VLCLGRECPSTPGLPNSFWSWLTQEQRRRAAWRTEIDSSIENTLIHLFDDFFRLRENIVDGALIAHLCQGPAGDGWVAPLLQIQRSAVESTFVLGNRPLTEVIRAIQEILGRWLQDSKSLGLSPAGQAAIDHIMSSGIQGTPLVELSKEVLSELEATQPEFFVRLRVRLDKYSQ
jgi:hypothetical protein